MNFFERWILKRTFAKQVRQGITHDARINELYGMIRDAAEAEFTEDNAATLDIYMWERFNTSQKAVVVRLPESTKPAPSLGAILKFGKGEL